MLFKDQLTKERIKFFVLGMLVVIGMGMLISANITVVPMDLSEKSKEMPVLGNGRYQISAWGGTFGSHSGGFGAFVVDTLSGESKIVYICVYGAPDKGNVVNNNLNKPFASME